MKQYFLYLIVFVIMLTSVFGAADLSITTNNDFIANYNEGAKLGSFIVANNGNQDAIDVSFSGNFINGSSPIAVNYMNGPLNISVGNSVTFNYNVSITNQQATAYVLSLSATGTNLSGNLSGKTTATLTVQPFRNISINVPTGISVAKGLTKTLTVSVQNTGNVDINANYSISNPSVGIDSSSKGYSVTYGSTTSLSIPVHIDSNVNTGTYTATVQVCYTTTSCVSKDVLVDVVNPTNAFGVSGNTAAQQVNLQEINTYVFTVSNTGTVQENINVSLSGLTDTFNVSFSPKQFSLNGGQSQDVTITIDNYDEDIRAQDTEYDTTYKGTFTVTDGRNASSYVLSLNTKSMLAIEDLVKRLNGVKKTGTISSATPGSTIEVEFDLKNTYTEKIEMNGYTVNAYIEDVDNGDALELDEVSGGSISKKSSDQVYLNFTVPYLADRNTYTLVIEIEADDEFGNTHYLENKEVRFTVTKDQHKMAFENLKLDNEIVTCDYTSLRYTGRLVNIGRSDEKDVKITSEIIGQPQYNIESKSTIRETDYETISELFDVASLQNGRYTLKVTAEYYGSQVVSQEMQFKVDCTKGASNQGTGNQGTVIPNNNGNQNPVIPNDQNNDLSGLTPANNETSVNNNSKNNDIVYISILAIAILIVFVAIVVLLLKLIKKM